MTKDQKKVDYGRQPPLQNSPRMSVIDQKSGVKERRENFLKMGRIRLQERGKQNKKLHDKKKKDGRAGKTDDQV